MPLEPIMKRRIIDYFRIRKDHHDIFRKGLITKSITRRIFEHGNWRTGDETKMDARTIESYDEYFKGANTKTKNLKLRDYIKEFIVRKKRGPKILDIGSGEGNVGRDLEREFGRGISYSGVDIKDREYKRIQKLDVVSEKLPRNSFDIIVSYYVFDYFTDKFSALENMINALRVDGILHIRPVSSIFVRGRNGGYFTLEDHILEKELRRANPFLEIDISPSGITIKRKDKGNANIPFRYIGARPRSLEGVSMLLDQDQLNGGFAMHSFYEYDQNKKTKW